MAAKFIILAALAAAAQAGGGGYSYSYGVNDPNTGDIKSAHERKVGNSVVGQYSLLESDGSQRTVDYESHPQTGFNAVVKNDPPYGVHPPPGAYNGRLNGYAGAAGYGGLAGVAPLAGIAGPLAHGGLAAPLPLAAPLAHGALANPIAHGALARPLAGGFVGAGPLGLAGRATSYANIIRYPAHGNGYPGTNFAAAAYPGAGYAGYGAGYGAGYAGYGAGYGAGYAGNIGGYGGIGAGYLGAQVAPLAYGAINPLAHGVAPLGAPGQYGAGW